MTTIHFQLTSPLSPTEAFDVLTDFGPNRPDVWPSIDASQYTVHSRGENWAEVTEGTAAAWERARYEWDAVALHVAVTTHESKLFGAGGGWDFRFTPVEQGTLIDVELHREPHGLKQRLIGTLLKLVGPATFKKGFAVPFRVGAGTARP
jgi:hypothetical protein